LLLCVLTCLISMASMPLSHAVGADEVDEADAKVAAERFLTVLVKNPRFGTAFDRVYGFCIDRGSIATLKELLRSAAKLPEEFAPAAGTITSDMVTLELPANVDPGAACLLFGMIELRHSEADAASRVLKQAAELRPKDPVAHWYLAKALALGQKFDESAASLEQAIASRPAKIDLLEIYKELARTHQRAQKTDAALAVWERLEQAFPGDLRVKEQIAATLTEDGRWEEALVRYQALVKETRNADQRVQSSLAASDVLIQLGRSQEAIAVLETQLSDLDPDSWLYKEIRRRIEGTFRSRNDLPGLVTYYEQWLSAHADDVDAMARLARTLSLQNETANAADWYRKAIELAPSNASLRESLIEQLVREDKISDAIVQYEELSKFDSGNLDHLEDWGQLIISQKDVPQEERQAKAAAVWNRMLENRADDSVTLSRLAGLFRRADVRERAIELYRQAIEKSPNEPQYREYLGEYLHQLQRTDEAVAEWKQIADGDRRSKASLIRLAEVLNRFGQNELALASMREACGMNPEPTERLQFAEMLRNWRAAGREAVETVSNDGTQRTDGTNEGADGSGRSIEDDKYLTEALQQLDLAEQSTEATDERQQILNERVKCLQVAGQLESQIQRISAELSAGTNVTADRWRILATYQDAAEKLDEATASAIKVVELEPDSISGWSILADLYERTGRLGDAADAMKKLASLDRRGISEYLRKTARLQVRLGQFEDALTTGREVIKATPGNPEAYQFFADLAFEVGQPQEAVESLRRAVRVNPGDEASLRALAKTLADEFQTPEAIELYWRAFEKAADLDSQTQIVVALSNLYLRSNQFPKLIERLELRSRELNLPTEMTRCIATAYREAGDFRKARETISRLSLDTADVVPALREQLSLAVAEKNEKDAVELSVEIYRRTQTNSDADLAISHLQALGDEAAITNLQLEYAKSPGNERLLLNVAVSLMAQGERTQSIELLQKWIANHPNDWIAKTHYASVLLKDKNYQNARAVCDSIINAGLDWDSTVDAPRPARPNQRPGEGPGSMSGSPEPDSYGAAYLTTAKWLTDGTFPVDLRVGFESLLQKTASLYGTSEVSVLIDHLGDSQPESQALWMAVDNTIEQISEPDRSLMLVKSIARQHRGVSTNESKTSQRFVDSFLYLCEHVPERALGLCSEMQDSDRENIARLFTASEAESFFRRTLDIAVAHDNEIQRLNIAVAVAFLHGRPDLARSVILSLADMELSVQKADGPDEWTLLDGLPITWGKSLLESKDSTTTWAILKVCFSRLKHPELSKSDIPKGSPPSLNNLLKERLGVLCASDVATACYVLGHLSSEEVHNSFFEAILAESWVIQSPDAEVAIRVAYAKYLENIGEYSAATMQLLLAAENEASNPSLRFLIAEQAFNAHLDHVGLEVLESIRATDVDMEIMIATFAFHYSQRVKDDERQKIAITMLLRLPVSSELTRELLQATERQGMRAEHEALVARLGRGAETRQSVLARQLQTYTAQGNNELAGEVAWELLKLASGGTLFSGQRPNDDRDDGGERLQAIKALGKLGRLQPLIDRYEAMLEASPESLDLLEILCEFHEAAEQFPQLSEKRDRIARLSQKAPPSLKAKAVALENSGDVSGACEIYLQILKDDPQAFSEDMETYVQAFERAKRHADFLSAVLGGDEQYWSEHAGLIVNMIADLARAKTNDGVVQKSIDAMLANEETRRFAIGGFLARAEVIAEEKLLPAIQGELTSEDAFSDISRINQSFLILQAVKDESGLKTLYEFLLSRRAAGRQPSERSLDLPLLYITARLGLREQVEQQIATITSGSTEAELLQPAEILTLNTRLKELSKDWDRVRTQLLEYLVSLKIEDTETADTVLDELGAAWESLGELQKARGILNERVQRMLVNTGAATGNASESIRQLLQAGEKIQHSGFPIEGARLLLNVTPHDIDEFTDDLDDDKAIAFKSRFNASQRWARQQISAEKLVAWYAMAVDDVVAAAADSKNGNGNLADQPVDLLLELSGTTDPRCRDAEELGGLRLDSVLLSVISKSTFESEELRQRIKAATETLLAQPATDVRLLTVALALAIQAADEEMLNRICSKSLEVSGMADSSGTAADKAATVGRPNRIPEILRREADLSCVLMAGLIANRQEQKGLVNRMLQRSIVAANGSTNRLIKVAVLQECVAVSKRAGLAELVAQCEQLAAAAIDEQIKATSVGIEGEIDLAHEIRTRLLGK
jgi:tetratricopeptide (TPR) repeat protein